MAQADGLEGSFKKAEVGLFPVLRLFYDQLNLNVKSFVCLHFHCREGGSVQSDQTRLEEWNELEAQRGSPTRHVLFDAREKNRNLHESLRETRTQYDQELANLRYACEGVQSQLAIFGRSIEASCDSLLCCHWPIGCISMCFCVFAFAFWVKFIFWTRRIFNEGRTIWRWHCRCSWYLYCWVDLVNFRLLEARALLH